MRAIFGWSLGASLLLACADAEVIAGSGGAGGGGAGGEAGAYIWRLPRNFPRPQVPEDNPMTVAKVALGRRLFYDKRLSGNGTFSCASCHRQELAFTDGRAQAEGSTGQAHARGSMSLAGVAYAPTLTWANPLMTTLEKQALVPMFGETPVELGLAGQEGEALGRLRSEAVYQKLFPEAFPGQGDPFTIEAVVKAIACFERTMISGTSRFDLHEAGAVGALTEAELRGRDLFFSERLECFHCHGGFLLADATFERKKLSEVTFHNTGLYNLDGEGAYPPDNQGVMGVTLKASDMGRFKAPTLRNIAVTAPYFHDGSAATLDEVIDHYAAGGRAIKAGPYQGDGAASPLKSEFLLGFELSAQERADLISFLKSLTDEDFLHNPGLGDPWAPGASP